MQTALAAYMGVTPSPLMLKTCSIGSSGDSARINDCLRFPGCGVEDTSGHQGSLGRGPLLVDCQARAMGAGIARLCVHSQLCQMAREPQFALGGELSGTISKPRCTAGEVCNLRSHRCNVWQGTFPSDNTCADGFYGLAPVDAFEPDGYGLSSMAGNAWEWCSDWHVTRRFPDIVAGPIANPRGPASGTRRVMRGGSYLCHPSYCWRYRNAARSAAAPESSTGHVGFRCARPM